MKTASMFRLLMFLVIALIIVSVVTVFLYTTDLAFSVWEHLQEAPVWLQIAYALLAILGGGTTIWLLYKLLKPAKIEPERSIRNEQELQDYIAELRDQGIDTEHASQELEQLRQRRTAGEIHVALCGEISTGKSSLIKALIPQAQVSTSPVGGTTRDIQRYTWSSAAGDRLIIDDLPGLNEANGQLDRLTLDESARSHVVLFVVDNDLTRDQQHALQALANLGKPIIIVMNKADRFDEVTRRRIKERIRESAPESIENLKVAVVSAGGMEEVTRIDASGREETLLRERPPKVEELRNQLQQIMDNNPEVLEKLRDAAVFSLTQNKLDQQVAAARTKKAEQIIASYSRKAVVGAMAAITPGSDVVIQGAIGYRMVQALSENYQIPAKSINIDHFLELAGKQVMRTLPLTLAVAGNLLKVFPGVGTLSGGLLHAVAYGLMVESLGKAVSATLAARGKLPIKAALSLYEEKLAENLESRATKLLKYALSQRSGDQ